LFPTATKEQGSLYNDGGDTIPHDIDHSTGVAQAELVADKLGQSFFQQGLQIGSFGTVEDPCMVESTLGYRIVGCTGGEGGEEHDIAWFELHQDRPCLCDVCGQYFELQATAPPNVVVPGVAQDVH